MNQQQVKQVTRYLRMWVRAYANSVELAAFVAENVLSGKETEFSHLDQGFLQALDHVLYHISHSARAALRMLRQQRSALTRPQRAAVQQQYRQFRKTTTRLSALGEALNDIYVFRKPPH